MAYCTAAQVKAIVDTDMSDATVSELIDECDDILDLMLDMGSMSANVRRALSRTYTAIRVMLKDPESMGLGELRYDRRYALEKLNEEFNRMKKRAGGAIAMQYHSESLPRW